MSTRLIRSFKISGLHGYKDIEISFSGKARIVIAENGTGKTAILSALNAFLRCDFDSLRSLEFESIHCEFSNMSGSLDLSRDQLPQVVEPTNEHRLAALTTYSSTSAREVRAAIMEIGRGDDIEISIRESPILHEIYQDSPHSMPDMISLIEELRAHFESSQSDQVKELTKKVKSAIGDREVLYLPTYRRVERPLVTAESADTRSTNIQRFTQRPPPSRQRWAKMGIQFGLADVRTRITSLLTDIQRQSNAGYRVLSANIIDELLETRALEFGPAQLPDISALELFFSRIEQSNDSANRVKSIRALYESGSINEPSNRPLVYFLAKLSRVVDRTREMEGNIEQFVAHANNYLKSSSDEKELSYSASRMRVYVKNSWTGSEVRMDELSSGEKQVISLFAHLYLYPERKFVLIDEPELSLSIDWQKKLLPDILSSPTCSQLLAITHSPFVFDNELDPYAGPLSIHRRQVRKE